MSEEKIKKQPGPLRSAAMKAFLLSMCRIAFRPKVTYISDKAREEALREPQVLIANHVRGMDGAVVYAALRVQNITALAASDTQETYPILQWLFRYLPVVNIDRLNVSMSWLRESRKQLRQGQHILIFPEGKCNKQRIMQPFKSGTVLLGASAGVKVTPIFHNGVYHYFFGRRFRMIIGEPIELMPPPEGVSAEVIAEEANRLYDTMHDLELALNGFIRTDEHSVLRRSNRDGSAQ